jgi:Tfp pilus assembly protein FimV
MGVFRQSSLRALAPASLVVFAIVLLIVVIASLTGNDDSSSTQPERVTITEPPKRDRARERARRERRLAARGIYVVRAGDNLFTIANKTGVPIETLRELNPTADPQGLITGQHIRLPVAGEPGATGASGATGSSGASGPR